MVVVFHCCRYILRWNVARYRQPRKGVSSAVQWVSAALERPLGPVALYGLGLGLGTIVATVVLIAVVRSVNLSLNFSDVMISDGG